MTLISRFSRESDGERVPDSVINLPSSKPFQLWYAAAATAWLLPMVFEVTPLVTITFSAYDFLYIYDGDESTVNAYLTVIKVETIAPFIAAAALHLVIAVLIAFQVGQKNGPYDCTTKEEMLS